MSTKILGLNTKQFFFLILLLMIFMGISAFVFNTNRHEPKVFEHDPFVSYAHGAFYWEDGIAKPDTEYLLNVQSHYILKTELTIRSNIRNEVKKIIYDLLSNKVLANALYLDWLLKQAKNEIVSRVSVINSAVRWYYISTIQINPPPSLAGGYWTKGISLELIKILQHKGLDLFQQANTSNTTYKEDCIAAGVPVPNTLFDNEWETFGTLDDVLGNARPHNEIALYVSEEPSGFCMSMVRSFGEDDDRGHIDLICMGQESSNACFFENLAFDNNIEGVIDIAELYAGNDIPIGAGSAAPCTGCHLGENALIIHPHESAFHTALLAKSVQLQNATNFNGDNYYHPFGVPNWPPNPSPLNLSIIDSKKSCSNCHVQSSAGRFPDVAATSDPTLYDFYCSVVLRGVLDENSTSFPATMPMNDIDNTSDYAGHKNYLLSMCDKTNTDDGDLVDNTFDDDPFVLSPPRIIAPLYQCAEAVYVDGVVKNASVELIINDTVVSVADVGQVLAPIRFPNIGKLKTGDIVQTRQRENGTWSETSTPKIVADYKNDYPNGLPAPTIDPNTIYDCSSVMSVRYDIPGFKVEVWVNDEDAVTDVTFPGHLTVTPGKSPFALDDEFTAQVSACEDKSPMSVGVKAQRTSNSVLSAAQIKTTPLFEGQRFMQIDNLTYGSQAEVLETVSGSLVSFSTPMSWKVTSINSSLSVTDQFVVTQQLCDFNSQSFVSQSPAVLSCAALPAPVIQNPVSGQDFVKLIQPLLSARVRIYDESGNELGDGTGHMVKLNRALSDGEKIIAVQQIGDCVSSQGYQIEV